MQAHIQEPHQPQVQGTAIFALGFRPFFLLAGFSAVLLMLPWLLHYIAGLSLGGYYDDVGWHSHEMLFGYSTAVVAGFLLTAVRNWSGIDTPSGLPLAGLALLWLLGRLLPWFPDSLPHGLIAAVDIAFMPAIGVAVGIPLVKARQPHNYMFIAILLGYGAANLLIHLQLLGVTQDTAGVGTSLAVYLTILVIAILAGRVLPFFIERALIGATTRSPRLNEQACFISLVLFMLAVTFSAPAALVALLALATAISHGLRLYLWHVKRLWRVPLLWVLYIGYGWLVVGFFLETLAHLELISPFISLHALTTGSIGALTLGMMSRVSLGHTGRVMRSARVIDYAFALVILAAVVRVFGPLLFNQGYSLIIALSGTLWLAAFAIFLVIYFPILIRPRADGLPG